MPTAQREPLEDDESDCVWVYADPLRADYGAPADADDAAAAEQSRVGPYSLLRRPDGTVASMRLVPQSSVSSLAGAARRERQRSPPNRALHGAAGPAAGAEPAEGGDEQQPRCRDRRAKLSQMDVFMHRPPMLPRRVLYGLVMFGGYAWLVERASRGTAPPLLWVPLLVTLVYPPLISGASRLMEQRSSPVQARVFELLLAYDLYLALASAVITVCTLLEAYRLGMAWPPWGHLGSESSPLLRQLIWWHYHNRQVELFDTVFRISQKRFGTYGAMHFYLRLVNVWSWYMAACVGGGDVWFLAFVDGGVATLRYACFLLSLLKWSRWNPLIDFGMHAPKIRLLRTEHLYQLHLGEFGLLAVHALFMLWAGNVGRGMAALQLVVMLQSAAVFTDWAHGHSDPEMELQRSDPRLVFSFDSSGWLYLYHFGVAMWVEDNIDTSGEDVGFSGSSGGALVGATLATGVDPQTLAEHVLKVGFPAAGRNPFKLMSQVEQALDKFLPQDAWLPGQATGRLRVLLTRVSPKPPFLTGEVVSQYPSYKALFTVLRATCHIPGIGGLLPYPVLSRSGWYYDGLVWSSLFVPWRGFNRGDRVLKVSAFGAPGAHIRPSVRVPLWWALFPPSAEVLRGLMWQGYRDAREFFESQGASPRKPWRECGCGPPTDISPHRRRRGSGAQRELWLSLSSKLRSAGGAAELNRFDEEAERSCERLRAETRSAWVKMLIAGAVYGALWLAALCYTLGLTFG